MDFPCADNSCIVFTVLLLIMAASCVHALFMLHSLQPVHGGVNFILAQLYLGVYTSPTSCCPLCSEPSSSVHCHYRRVLRDVPCASRRVQLVLTVRKFSCRNAYCARKVFAERLPDFVEPWARTTIRFCQQITSVGLS